MKKLVSIASIRWTVIISGLLAIPLINGCDKDDDIPPTPASLQSFNTVNLVASDASFTGARVDPHLINGWGIAFSATGTAWISSPGDHSSVVYNSTGAQVLAPVSIPTHAATTGGIPTGQIFNGSTGFKLPNGNPARFIFAGIDGVISGWNGGTAAISKVDRNGTSVYTGLAIGSVSTDTFLYAADFKSGKIDVFDKNYALQTSSFTDPSLPAGYSPFNIQNIGGLLYVAYAQPDPATGTEKKGLGLGIVSVFNANGSFVKRLVSNGGSLNAPWGIAKAPASWLTQAASSTVILIGNFGDGHINAYDATTNDWLGTLQSNGTIITIDGLWAISFAPSTATAINPDWLFFTAGPAAATKGLFGYVSK
jgi:uncharacterized protein (TIGR03118 family)